MFRLGVVIGVHIQETIRGKMSGGPPYSPAGYTLCNDSRIKDVILSDSARLGVKSDIANVKIPVSRPKARFDSGVFIVSTPCGMVKLVINEERCSQRVVQTSVICAALLLISDCQERSGRNSLS